jgi:nucleoside-diphosphate-sugar epimerase
LIVRVFVVGATGYIGTSVSRHLRAAGHEVVGLARSDASADCLARDGVAVHRGDLADHGSIRDAATEADAIVHAAVGVQVGLVSDVDVAAVDAMIDGLAGTGRPLILTSGVAVYAGSAAGVVDEDTPLDSALPAQIPRIQLEDRVVRAAERGVRTVVLRPGFGYGHARAGLLIRVQLDRARRTGVGAYIGDGSGLFPVVHVDDLARAYVRAVEHGRAGARFNVVGGTYSAREIAAAVSHAVGGGGHTASLSVDEARDAWGLLAGVLLDFPPVSALRATAELGWTPREASLPYELVHGSLRQRS